MEERWDLDTPIARCRETKHVHSNGRKRNPSEVGLKVFGK